MATFLCSALLALQGAALAPAESLTGWWARVRADATDAGAWLALGRAYVGRAAAYHARHAPDGAATAASALDTAAAAFGHAAAHATGAARDTAAAFRVFTWGERAFLVWETEGLEAAATAATPPPDGLRLPAVVAELGENLLRACPPEAILLTGDDADTYGAWFLRFGRGLRPDVLVLPWAIYRADSALRVRVRAELALPRTGDEERDLRLLAGRRPLCASMALDAPPHAVGANRISWQAAALVWLAGPVTTPPVPASDFVFEAARLARDDADPWLAPVLRVYRRAARVVPALCGALDAFRIAGDVGCARP
jgi:hypothetical protein